MPSERRERSGSAGSNRSGHSRASSSMGFDGGEAGRRMAIEDEFIRRELADSTTFCNSFWGINDAGYPVIQSRMKGAQRVLDDLRAMYKERADIEAEYSKRLAKLCKQSFGKDETGSMKAAIDVVRMEIEQTSKTHSDLSQLIKKDLEGGLTEYSAKVQNQRKNSLAQIEKLYKQKQTQESYVNKSRDKYEQDCIKINGYTAQSSLVQGRDLDKVTTKLDKAQSTVSSNDKDYQNFVRALKDTTYRWNAEWKSYLDQCQDLEEDRLEVLKSNLWNYANAISAVCVADDESCERVRVALESCEAPRDIVDFIQRAGTGSAIADPPEYINYSKGQPPPPRPTFKTANFQRSTARQTTYLPTGAPPPPTNGGVSPGGRSGGAPPPDIPMQASQSRKDSLGPSASQMAAFAPSSTQATNLSSARDDTMDSIPQPQQSEMSKSDKRMSAKNFMARTPSMSKQNRNQQQAPLNSVPPSDTISTVSTNLTTIDHEDPIAKALANLKMRPGGKSPGPQSPAQAPPPPSKQYGTDVGPHRAPSPSFSHEPRARSPSAAFMQEPDARAASPLPVEEVLDSYGQHFPGERRTPSRQNSTASRHSRMSMQPLVAAPDRARSPGPSAEGGFAGVGARGRSPSPQPFRQQQQPSQQQQQQQQRPSSRQQQQQQPTRPGALYGQQQQQANAQPRPSAAAASSGRSGAGAPATQTGPARSTTPLGIALDASGSVTHDQMADEFIRRSGSVGPGQVGPSASQPAVQRLQSQYGAHPGTSASPVHSAAATPGHGYAPPHLQQHHSYASMSGQYAPQQAAPHMQQQQQPPGAQYPYQAPPQSFTPSQAPAQLVHHPSHQDSMGSLGRQGGYAAHPSQYNQTPAAAVHPSATQPSISQPPTPAPSMHTYGPPGHSQQNAPPPSASQYGRVASPYQAPPAQESPAAAYAHQYQMSHHAPTPASSTPNPVQQGGYQQQQVSRWSGQAPPAAASYGSNQGPYVQPSQPTPQQASMMQPQPQHQQGAPSRSNVQTAPPTGQFSDQGKPILFYVKALYDYQATTEEEFSFTGGDVIAVWETNPDGWWQGELLDDARRRPGANTFPSNFVSLLN